MLHTVVYQMVILESSNGVQNAAARVITGKTKRESISMCLKELHWLPIKYRGPAQINNISVQMSSRGDTTVPTGFTSQATMP